MYTTGFSDFVLATQGMHFALSSLAREAFQGDKEADPAVSRCLRWKEGERGQGLEEHYVLVLNVYRSGHCRVRSVEKRGTYSDELSVHSSLC